MNFFSFLRSGAAEPVLLIDIGSSSITGAFAHISQHEKHKPVIYYDARVPIRARSGASTLEDMEHALATLTDTLLHEGAPHFARAVGEGRVARVVVSIASPWQETNVRVEHMMRPTTFRFTRKLLEELVAKSVTPAPGRTHTAEMVIATRLNGYDVEHPFGKRAAEAEVVVLSSSVATDAAKAIRTKLRRAFNVPTVTFAAFPSVLFIALRELYPSDSDFFAIDVSGESTDFILVKDAALLEVMSVSHGLNELRRAAIEAGINTTAGDEPLGAVKETDLLDPARNDRFAKRMQDARNTWLAGITDALQTLATRYALPRTAFILADASARGFLAHTLDEHAFRSLWFSDESPHITYVEPEQFATHVIQEADGAQNVFVAMLALYASRVL